MDDNISDCRDFILFTLRQIRRNPLNLTKGTKAGVWLHKLAPIALQVFDRKVFVEGLNDVIESKTLIVFCDVSYREEKHSKGSPWVGKTVLIGNIDPDIHVEERHTCFYTMCLDSKRRLKSSGMRLYIAEDGLPLTISRLYKKCIIEGEVHVIKKIENTK